MHEVSISPEWTIRSPRGESLSPRVVELLVKVHEHGSLSSACAAAGASYRHAWQLLRQGEALFGEPLLRMERGKGSQLTALGEKLVWADRRIAARLSPLLDTLASELSAEIGKVLSTVPTGLRLHASHGFAVQALHNLLVHQEAGIELKYCGTAEALGSLNSGGCELAGFHVPIGEHQAATVAHYSRWFNPRSHRVIGVASRRQGLIVAAGNPKKIYEVKDLPRPDVRFINRQPGSGTRFLLDLLLRAEGIDPATIRGYEQCEYTHAAVAAYVASDMADAGFGVEVPARQFKLEFIPTQVERYFLLCDEKTLETPAVREVLAILRSDEYQSAVNQLPGYRAEGAGQVASLEDSFAPRRPAADRGSPAGRPRAS